MAKITLSQLNKAALNANKIKELYINMLVELVNDASKKAIQAATKASPINKTKGMKSKGSLREHWEIDSDKEATIKDKKISYTIRNLIPYAKYVDLGHSMDQHYVPGLFINDNGELEYQEGHSGIIVGTKTSWVEGRFMSKKAKDAFYDYIEKQYPKRMEKLWKTIMGK